MRRVLLVGEGPSTESLQRLLQIAGAEVVVIAPDRTICGKGDVKIIVDDLCSQIDNVMLNGSRISRNPVGLLQSIQPQATRDPWKLSSRTAAFDPQSYLKRKKGRATVPGRRIGATLNNVAKRPNRA
jgi:hypothetical protein